MDTTHTPPDRAVKARDGHERAIVPLDEWLRLIELSSLTEHRLAAELHEQVRMTQAAAVIAQSKLRKRRILTLRRDFYEAAIERLQADLAPLDAEAQALVRICLTAPYLAAAEDDLAWAREGAEQHERRAAFLRELEAEMEQRTERHGRVVHEQRAKLAALSASG